MLGELRIPLRKNRYFVVTGGPFREVPAEMFGVKMAAEISHPNDVDIPTKDFDVPSQVLLRDGLIKAVEAMVQGKPVYVGCMAGKGRTGLFLAVLAKAAGMKHPVEYVRENYYAHAVETTKQYEFVTKFEIPHEVTKMLKKARFWSWFTFRQNLTETPHSCE